MLKKIPYMVCAAALAASFTAQSAPELGVYRWDAPGGPANVDAFSQWLGTPATLAEAFEAMDSWANVDGAEWQLGPWSQWVRAQSGRNLILSVPMFPQNIGASLSACSAGQYDQYWRNLANNLAYYGLHWAYVRPGWEMDGNWMPWKAEPGSGREAAYAGCFRRIVQTMRATQPANQWKFVWNPNNGKFSKAYLDAIYPGDAYVDVVAIDVYDQSWAVNTYPYPSPCDASCRLTRQQNAWNDYSQVLYQLRDYAISHGKPYAIPEWGVTVRSDGHGGGDNPYYIQKMHQFMMDPANYVVFHSYFDVRYSGWDSQISPAGNATNYPQAAAMFKQLFGPGNTAPSVSITSPAAGQTVSGTIPYAANATDNGGVSRVEFFVDATALPADTTAPYGGSLDTRTLANGTHVIRAVAYDAQGLSSSSQVSVNVQNAAALAASFAAPAAGATISGAFSNSSGCELTGTGIARVVFFMDTTQLNTETAAPWNCSLDTRQFSNGTHTLRAVAYNAAGASTTVLRSVNVQNGPAGPTVSFSAPADNGTLSGSFRNSSVCEVTGSGISHVVFFLDNTQLNTEKSAPWNCSIDTRKFANGSHTLKAVAYNSAGASTTITRTVTVKN